MINVAWTSEALSGTDAGDLEMLGEAFEVGITLVKSVCLGESACCFVFLPGVFSLPLFPRYEEGIQPSLPPIFPSHHPLGALSTTSTDTPSVKFNAPSTAIERKSPRVKYSTSGDLGCVRESPSAIVRS